MTADKVKQLTRKLKQQGDVSLEEAEWIYSLVEKNIEKNDPNLPAIALSEWYLSVSQKLENNECGNFIFQYLFVMTFIITFYGTRITRSRNTEVLKTASKKFV